MSCRSCDHALSDPRTDDLSIGCMSCKARALAATGAHVESIENRTISPRYRETLERAFGEQWKQGHELVKSWAQRIASVTAQRRAKAPTP